MTGRRGSAVPAAVVLALGMMAAAAVFGAFFVRARRGDQTVQVVGAATQAFESDVVKWSLSVTRSVSLTGLQAGYGDVQGDVQHLLDRLEAAGVERGQITVQPVTVNQTWGNGGEVTGYQLWQPLFLVSSAVDAVEELARSPGDLLRQGVVLQSSQLEYYYSGITELKHSLLAAATQDALARAEEIVGSANGTVGSMSSARAGVFQIREPYSTEVEGYGMHSTATRSKEITVTVHATFRVR
ncbi:MAG: SIMPL domain-containing protein [Gemmatimonadota bacterium]